MTRLFLLSCLMMVGFPRWATAQQSGHQADGKAGDHPAATAAGLAEMVRSMRAFDGFFRFYWDDATGRILLEVPRSREEFLAVTALRTGLGSNPVGLDRGKFGETRVVRFRRIGDKLLLIQRNQGHRALTNNPAEIRAVRESFPDSVLWTGQILASSAEADLVDWTSYLLQDDVEAAASIRRAGQGEYRLDPARSAVELEHTFAFPDNVEFDALLTFTAAEPGGLIAGVAAEPRAVTLHQHHSLIRLPDAGYRPRRFDPRAGAFSIAYADYAAALDAPLESRWITRHRLRKQYPERVKSPPLEPIVYYLDPGAPQPVQDALLVGARWWNEAFEAAGFENAFQVQLLPEDAHPLDVRYNVIQWVHRATRGWSYGQSIIDPRTGEILKGHVLLGSQRVRQDRRLLRGLAGPGEHAREARQAALGADCRGDFALPEERFLATLAPDASPLSIALARIRQLSAHEVGHTLGFAHNFAASTYGDRASVMDYPAPRVIIDTQGRLDLSDAYGVGVGAWDKFAVAYAYTQFAEGQDEDAELDKLVQAAQAQGLLYLSDGDARPAGAAEPRANLWDNGQQPVAELRHVYQVRELALSRFLDHAQQPGKWQADLEADFAPVYLHHRYQVEAVLKMLGGYRYHYAVAGDGQPGVAAVSVAEQRAALEALLQSLEPAFLAIPDAVLERLPPPPVSGYEDRERFSGRTGRIFDWLGAAETAADLVLAGLLQPQRASRLAAEVREDWGLAETCRIVRRKLFPEGVADEPRQLLLREMTQSLWVRRLIALARTSSANDAARATAEDELLQLRDLLSVQDSSHAQRLAREIARFFERQDASEAAPATLDAPPGSPIGGREPDR